MSSSKKENVDKSIQQEIRSDIKKTADNSKLIGPPVDGIKGSPEKMFMWANNVTSPLCCPSTFSSSTGCVCSTKNQRDFINGRGMINKTEIDSEI